MEQNQAATYLFAKAPISKAVLKNAVPAMIAMLMVLVYNLADTFFIGQTRNDILVASVSLATPVFLLFMAAGTIFGIGGTSVISRALGEGRLDYARKVCAFCMWSCVIFGIVMSAAFLMFMDGLLDLIGASADTWEPTKLYLTIVSLSGPFVLISTCYSNVVRAEGQSTRAMMGQLLGNVINIVLDPLMILGFGWGIAGAAIATVIGNIAGTVYYLAYFLSGKSELSISIRDFTGKDRICWNVLAIGIPAALGSMMMSFSQIIVNALMANQDDMALAGMGVAMKVTMITTLICIGFGQGVQPLLGYCMGANLEKRFRRVMRFSLLFALCLSAALTAVCYIFCGQIIGAFLTEDSAFGYATQFTQILLTTSILSGIFFVFLNALQAMGAAAQALVVNLSRQGIIYIPVLFLLHAILGVIGVAWAQPVADVLSTILVAFLFYRAVRPFYASDLRNPGGIPEHS